MDQVIEPDWQKSNLWSGTSNRRKLMSWWIYLPVSRSGKVEQIAVGECFTCLYDKENCECLVSDIEIYVDDEDRCQYGMVKQQSKQWHEIRKRAPITGSTAYCALGKELLKKQKEHVSKPEGKMGETEMKEVMTWGTTNEMHAMATLDNYILLSSD